MQKKMNYTKQFSKILVIAIMPLYFFLQNSENFMVIHMEEYRTEIFSSSMIVIMILRIFSGGN